MSVNQSDDKKELAKSIKSFLGNCVGFTGDEMDASRKQAYDYYFQRPRGDEVAGRSTIVTGDLSSMVEGNLAQMVEPLVAPRIAEFCAYDSADEEQANLESDCVHEMVFSRQNGFLEVTSAIKDAMLVRNSVVKIYVDTRTYTQRVTRTNVEPIVVAKLLEQFGATRIHKYDPDSKTLSATVEKTTKKFCVESLAPENFLIVKGWHKQDLEGVPFCAERHLEPRSALVERGFSAALVEGLRRYSGSNGTTTSDARLPKTMTNTIGVVVADRGQELVEWYECYMRITSADGSSELRVISYSDDVVLSDESADTVCYAIGVLILNPHTFVGISQHDKLKSTQDSTTALTRALMDNLNGVNKPRTAHLEGVADTDALSDGRINNSIPVDPQGASDVRAAVAAFSIPDASANILSNLQHFAKVRAEMGGAALDMATGQMQLNDRLGSQGLDRAYSVMEQNAAFMTRIMAQTLIRQVYLIAHSILRTQWETPIQWKRGNVWVRTNPAQWQARESIKVNLGMSLGERQRLALAYEKVMAKQEALAQNGMEDVLVDVSTYYKAFVDWMRVNDIPNPDGYVIDPRSPRAQKALVNKAQQRVMVQQKQDNLANAAIALEQAKVALDKYKHDSQLQFQYWDAVLNSEIEEAKITATAVTDITKVRMTAKSGESNEPGTKTESSTGSERKPAAEGSS